jgi:hypothetical protein
MDYATPIQKHLEKLNKIETETFDLQFKIIKQYDKKEEKVIEMDKINSKVDIINQDLQAENKSDLIDQIKQLLENIEIITEELDHLCLCNKKYQETITSDDNIILVLMEEVKELEQENLELKSISNLSYFDLFSETRCVNVCDQNENKDKNADNFNKIKINDSQNIPSNYKRIKSHGDDANTYNTYFNTQQLIGDDEEQSLNNKGKIIVKKHEIQNLKYNYGVKDKYYNFENNQGKSNNDYFSSLSCFNYDINYKIDK